MKRTAIQRRRIVFTTLFLVILSIVSSTLAPGASAHARLVESSPPSGTALVQMPDQILLTFTEAIDLNFSAAALQSDNGSPVATDPLQTTQSDRVLVVPIVNSGGAAPGVYILVWRVLSAVDGHVTTGALSFSAGTGRAPEIGGSVTDARPPWWRVAIRWGQILGLMAVGGAFVFQLWIVSSADRDFGPWPRRLVAFAVILLFISTLSAGYDVVLSASSSSIFGPPGLSEFWRIIWQTDSGRWWLTGAVCVLALTLLAFNTLRMKRVVSWVAYSGTLCAALALVSMSASGHAAATAPAWRNIAFDAVHLFAILGWFGTLPYLWLRMRDENADLPSVVRMVSRFSWIALGLMVTIFATGLVRAAAHVDGPRALGSSDYGVVLIGKHLLILPILIAAGVNLLILVPRLRRAGTPDWPGVMGSSERFIRVELITAILVLAAAATLTELPPADAPLPVDVAASPTLIEERATAGDLELLLMANLRGDSGDRYTITISDAFGNPPEVVQRVIVTTATDVNGVTAGDRFDATPLPGSSDTFSFSALQLGLRAIWEVGVTVRRAGIEDVTGVLTVDTTSAGQPPPRLVRDEWRLPRFTIPAWALGFFAFALFIGGLYALRRLPELQPFASAIFLTMLVLIVAGFLVQAYRLTIPVTSATNLANPTAPDAASIQRGSGQYATFCLRCHAADGAGITDDTMQHDAAGADLTDRRTHMQHDGDLFFSISSGVPGTEMPAYDEALTESERWDVVNYLRILQSAAP